MNRLSLINSGPTGVPSRYDALIASLGYESRAIHASQKIGGNAAQRVACGFPDRQVLAFAENQRWFIDAGFDVVVVKDLEVEEWSNRLVTELISPSADSPEFRLCVDISSMSRLRLACLLSAIVNCKTSKRLVVDFVYSIAAWSPPPEEGEPIERAGPVLPFFAGWSNQPDLPTVAVIGLGYEPDKAVGAYEFLEAADVWVLVPISDDSRYRRDLERANRSLLNRLPAAHRITYSVDQPVSCFGIVESIVYGTLGRSRPVLLPFGPKICALCSLLVATLHRDASVWRITSGQEGDPSDRKAAGPIIVLQSVFVPLGGTAQKRSGPTGARHR